MAKPLLIAVAPNGARRTQRDHTCLPISPLELAKTAVQCCDAGASMLHLHVRDAADRHTLDVNSYRAALKEIESAVGDRMLIQVTSEAAGVYHAQQQMESIRQLQPRCVSLGLREIIKDESALDIAGGFLTELKNQECLVQYILYGIEDINWYQRLCNEGVIPSPDNFVLLVLGRYGKQEYQADDLPAYLETFQRPGNWMVCAFGAQEHKVMSQAAGLGGHARVGFENNLWLPDGSLAKDNAALVTVTAESARKCGRELADVEQAISLFGGPLVN